MKHTIYPQGALRLLVAGVIQPDISFTLADDSAVVLGSEPSCDIPLICYANVERRHASVRALKSLAGEWAIYDLNSSNGTYINGELLGGGQVLRDGDHISLGENGPEFIFEYKQVNKTTVAATSQKKATRKHNQVIKEKDYWLKLLPTKLVIERRTKKVGWSYLASFLVNFIFYLLLSAILLSVFAAFLSQWFADFILSSSLVFLFWGGIGSIISHFSNPPVLDYSFDLDTDSLIIRSQSLLGWIFKASYRYQQYFLKEFTAVRLEKYQHEENSGKYYEHVYLERQVGKAIKLEVTWCNTPQQAQQVANLIEEYLQQIKL
jgi:pSer/pThr/pTyr-binding forkhead associated (FHA) protein